MADYLPACPNCGHVPSGFGVAYMDVLRCSGCGLRYCWKCPTSNQGRECPKCGKTEHTTVGRVAAR